MKKILISLSTGLLLTVSSSQIINNTYQTNNIVTNTNVKTQPLDALIKEIKRGFDLVKTITNKDTQNQLEEATNKTLIEIKDVIKKENLADNAIIKTSNLVLEQIINDISKKENYKKVIEDKVPLLRNWIIKNIFKTTLKNSEVELWNQYDSLTKVDFFEKLTTISDIADVEIIDLLPTVLPILLFGINSVTSEVGIVSALNLTYQGFKAFDDNSITVWSLFNSFHTILLDGTKVQNLLKIVVDSNTSLHKITDNLVIKGFTLETLANSWSWVFNGVFYFIKPKIEELLNKYIPLSLIEEYSSINININENIKTFSTLLTKFWNQREKLATWVDTVNNNIWDLLNAYGFDNTTNNFENNSIMKELHTFLNSKEGEAVVDTFFKLALVFISK